MAERKIKGVIWGQAIGDALGLTGEFYTKQKIAEVEGRITGYKRKRYDGHTLQWEEGAWTDDTDQFLCIAESLIEHKKVDLHDIARRFHYWGGHDGRGMGQHTLNVFTAKYFLCDPLAASKRIWLKGHKQSAPNGNVMRGAIAGLWQYDRPAAVRANAEVISKVTHYDDRCTFTAQLLAELVACFIRGDDCREIVNNYLKASKSLHKDAYYYLEKAISGDLEALDLDGTANPDNKAIGYTLKTMAAGLWAVLHAGSFREGVEVIINEGGDADTNGAVAGALLGARYGFKDIPQEWVEGLTGNERLTAVYEGMIQAQMGRVDGFDEELYRAVSERCIKERADEESEAEDEVPAPLERREGGSPLQIEVLSLSRLSNLNLGEGVAVISINDHGKKSFMQMPLYTLEVNFNDIEHPYLHMTGLKRIALRVAMKEGVLSPLAEKWLMKQTGPLPFLPAHKKEIIRFVECLPTDTVKLYIHCEFGRSRSAAVATKLHELLGCAVRFSETGVKPNQWIVNKWVMR